MEHLNLLGNNLPTQSRDISSNKVQRKSDKFCRYHITRTHSSEECKALKRKEKDRPDKEEKTFMIQEASQQLKPLSIPISLHGNRYLALLDTGASGNFISQEIVKKFKTKGEKSKEVTLTDGKIATKHGTAILNLTINGLTRTEFKVPFEFFKSKQTTIILGMAFLLEKNCKINLENGIITIDRQEFELPADTRSNQLDQTLMEKPEIDSLTEKYQVNIRNQISDAQQNNPQGNITI